MPQQTRSPRFPSVPLAARSLLSTRALKPSSLLATARTPWIQHIAARARRRSPCHGSSASGLIVGGGGAGLHAGVATAFAGLHRGGAGLHRDGAGLRDGAGFLAAGRFYMR